MSSQHVLPLDLPFQCYPIAFTMTIEHAGWLTASQPAKGEAARGNQNLWQPGPREGSIH